MDMRLPKEVLHWVDNNRGTQSRQGFIITLLLQLKQYPKNYNTQGLLNEVQNEANGVSSKAK